MQKATWIYLDEDYHVKHINYVARTCHHEIVMHADQGSSVHSVMLARLCQGIR